MKDKIFARYNISINTNILYVKYKCTATPEMRRYFG